MKMCHDRFVRRTLEKSFDELKKKLLRNQEQLLLFERTITELEQNYTFISLLKTLIR